MSSFIDVVMLILFVLFMVFVIGGYHRNKSSERESLKEEETNQDSNNDKLK